MDKEIIAAALKKLGGNYAYLERIGGGTSSEVYLLEHTVIKRKCALKIMDVDFILKAMEKEGTEERKEEFEKRKQRFLKEAQLCTTIDHPKIAKIIDAGVIVIESKKIDIPYILMQFVDGKTLKDVLREESTLELSRAVKIAKDILEALNEIHQKDVVHRDIKPANIIIEKESDRAILIDLGIAKDTIFSQSLTAKEALMGTPLYMAPEQFKGGSNVGPEADIYSFGVILYEMMAGEPPFKNSEIPQLMYAHLKKPIPDVRKKNPDLPLKLEKLIKKAMAKKASDRKDVDYYINEFWEIEDDKKVKPKKKEKNLSVAMAIFVILYASFFIIKILLKDDPYTTSVILHSNRFTFKKDQVEKIKKIRFDPERQEFNTEGRGESIYKDKASSFSCLNMVFLTKDGKTQKSFEGRTISKFDKQMLHAIEKRIHKNIRGFELARDWADSERRIIVSRYLLKRLGYKGKTPLKIKQSVDVIYNNAPHRIDIPVFVLGVVDKLPFGRFIISEEFNYNITQNTLTPFDLVERFHVYCADKEEKKLRGFVKEKFNFSEEVIEVYRDDENNRNLYEVVLKTVPYYKRDEFEKIKNESSKHSIFQEFRGSGFECVINFYDWKTPPERFRHVPPGYLTVYLKGRYIDCFDEFEIFLGESIGGVKVVKAQ